MSQDPTHAGPLTVSAGDVSVEKSFVADEFPVPALKFVIQSTSTEAVDIRLTDDVPTSFPMDCVGFHPDYENDNWTAYEDHRVEFVRTLAPEESVTTVYGIRLEETDEESAAFLVEPTLDLVSTHESGGPEAEGVEDIVGEESTDVVRDVLAGDADTVPGMEDSDLDTDADADANTEDPLAADIETAEQLDEVDAAEVVEAAERAENVDDIEELDLELDLDVEDPLVDDEHEQEAEPMEPLALDDPLAADDSHPADASADEPVTDSSTAETVEPRPIETDTVPAVVARSTETESELDASEEEDVEVDPEAGQADAAQSDAGDVSETATEAETADVIDTPASDQSKPGAVTSTSIAATLATEIREGSVDDDDLSLLKRELDIGVPTSVDVRIGRLQSQMDDLVAYSDALSEFIDEEGTGDQLVSEFREELESVSSSLTMLETALASAESDRVDLRDDVDNVATTVTAVEKRVETNTQDLSSVADEVEALAAVADDIDTLAETVDSLDTEMGDVRADVADVDTDVTETRAELHAELETVRDDLTTQVDDLQAGLAADVEELRDEMDDVQSELVELKQFRDRLGSAFGGDN
ncbi:hypothetical protein SAMN04487950_3946 [Halogranum rubrum]|uniref:Uncharacterized protein n=1 Tax=Halogranum rubrum TaxID=553466 RepID=A0A1I4I4A6_9EURY|nr:hypothetical protein [Halogranum rubrum]SFL49010.1 hypothetical protein SAMN04487950_3946 [Halogranum rubrum]